MEREKNEPVPPDALRWQGTCTSTKDESCSKETRSKTTQDAQQSSVTNITPSQKSAAKVPDTLARLPGLAGEANDAVSAYTSVNMKKRS